MSLDSSQITFRKAIFIKILESPWKLNNSTIDLPMVILQNVALILALKISKDLTNQDDCYRKFYLSTHEGHAEGWSKLQFWQIWCDSRGHLALGSTTLMIEPPKSMQVQIHLGPTFVFHSPSWVLIQPTAWNLWQSSIWAGLKLSSIYSSLFKGKTFIDHTQNGKRSNDRSLDSTPPQAFKG